MDNSFIIYRSIMMIIYLSFARWLESSLVQHTFLNEAILKIRKIFRGILTKGSELHIIYQNIPLGSVGWYSMVKK